MDLISDHKIAVVTSNNDVYIWDLRYLKTPAIKRKVTLANQIRDICSFPKTSGKEGFVCCSTEGRAAVEFIDSISSKLQDKFAFKCHREKKQVPLQETNSSGSVPQEVIYPVNSLAFSPKHHTFATAGSDGFVNVWDPFSKKRIYQLPKYPVGVVEVAFGNSLKDKSVLAIACSYNYELDENPVEVPSDRIYIRHLEESDIARSVKS